VLLELTLNLAWLAIAFAGAVYCITRQPSRRTVFAFACALALLFPIISVSDDINGTFNTDTAVVLAITVMLVGLIPLARLRAVAANFHAVAVATPSEPRSPPAR
jgi:hypothetical protein